MSPLSSVLTRPQAALNTQTSCKWVACLGSHAELYPHAECMDGERATSIRRGAHAELGPCAGCFSTKWAACCLCDCVRLGVADAWMEHVSTTSHEGKERTVAELCGVSSCTAQIFSTNGCAVLRGLECAA